MVYYNYNFLLLNYNFLLLIILIGFRIYFLIIISFFRRSKYSILGSLRSVSQTLSFDILIIFFLIILIIKNKKILIEKIILFFIIIFIIFFLIMILVELNRAPFDFLEGERELVSGYNLELRSVNFIFLFLGEYGLVIFYSYFFSLINNSFFLLFFFIVIVLIVIRRVYPRFRYDYLLRFC